MSETSGTERDAAGEAQRGANASGSAKAGENLPALQQWMAPPAEELPALAAGLVHEVKNPLAAIHMHLQLLEGYLDEIQEDELRAKTQKKVSIIKKEISGLDSTLHNFVSLIRPQARQKDLSVDLNQLVGDVIRLLEPQALREGIDLQYHPGATALLNSADSSFLKQIVLNLVLNSIQAFHESEIPLEERSIDVHTGRREGLPFFVVSDNGPGIPEDVQQKMFDPFFSTKQGKGSGLGLTLVKKMVGEIGGRMEVRSAPGQGASFAVILGGEQAPHLLQGGEANGECGADAR